ncbi:MAG TPA: ATP-binding protein, partial [Candidatus Binatia bacterium]|nr:ATP-binding protein [Candidatus Binatia bacterium]
MDVELRSEALAGVSEAVLLVSDSGPGVPPSALSKLFEPFYRLDEARGR